MSDFLKFMDELVHRFPLHVEIGYNRHCDWRIYVYKHGCANDYPDSVRDGEDAVLCDVQSSDIEYAFAQAQVEIKNWLVEHEGGY